MTRPTTAPRRRWRTFDGDAELVAAKDGAGYARVPVEYGPPR